MPCITYKCKKKPCVVGGFAVINFFPMFVILPCNAFSNCSSDFPKQKAPSNGHVATSADSTAPEQKATPKPKPAAKKTVEAPAPAKKEKTKAKKATKPAAKAKEVGAGDAPPQQEESKYYFRIGILLFYEVFFFVCLFLECIHDTCLMLT